MSRYCRLLRNNELCRSVTVEMSNEGERCFRRNRTAAADSYNDQGYQAVLCIPLNTMYYHIISEF